MSPLTTLSGTTPAATPQTADRAQLRKAVARQLTLGGTMSLEGFSTPDLETVAQSHHNHPVIKAKQVAEMFRQGNPSCCIEGHSS